ncbi:hypothetical protein GWK47_051984 [Chionoecetes opilio]|uniref:Uncharacterized protein n=1 Tax=Chionoecetes opilio TaxID=41210 RepID=A0A8J4Y0F9_CHIOP|nr:hypothetical protein GWK47_051984 [Chionoecetes opilio]
MVVAVAAVAVKTTRTDQQVRPDVSEVEGGGSNSSAYLRQSLHSISEAILASLARSDYSCPEVCAAVLPAACLGECRRRWLPRLVCRVLCYSSEMVCCRCPTPCHTPFQACYGACTGGDTSCKDHCIAEVNRCCSENTRAAHTKEINE